MGLMSNPTGDPRGGESRPMTGIKAIWLVGLVWLLLGTAHVALGATWETHTAAGLQAYQQGDYAEAEKQFRAALEKAR